MRALRNIGMFMAIMAATVWIHFMISPILAFVFVCIATIGGMLAVFFSLVIILKILAILFGID